MFVHFGRVDFLPRLLRAHPPASAVDFPRSALNIGFTCEGLRQLGLDGETVDQFSAAFVEGAAHSVRAARLGDTGENEPQGWRWGGPNTTDVHAVLMLFGEDAEVVSRLASSVRDLLDATDGHTVAEVRTSLLPGSREHFGFRSGIAQPRIASDCASDCRYGLFSGEADDNTLAPGEFILGYTNEFDEFSFSPRVEEGLDPCCELPASGRVRGHRDLGRNGTYMVLRQLEQDVQGFWRGLLALCENPAELELLAAKLVGRWRSGAPLVTSPDRDRPELATCDDFGYSEFDRDGTRCPLGAHIRRANPRDWRLAPSPKEAAAMSKLHRIIRHSRPYGPPVIGSFDPYQIVQAPEDGCERGLMFGCFNADFGRQFELIQESWLNGPNFARLHDEVDSLLGCREQKRFSVPARPFARRYDGIPSAIRVRGAGYFFVPSLRALKFLSRRALATIGPGGLAS